MDRKQNNKRLRAPAGLAGVRHIQRVQSAEANAFAGQTFSAHCLSSTPDWTQLSHYLAAKVSIVFARAVQLLEPSKGKQIAAELNFGYANAR